MNERRERDVVPLGCAVLIILSTCLFKELFHDGGCVASATRLTAALKPKPNLYAVSLLEELGGLLSLADAVVAADVNSQLDFFILHRLQSIHLAMPE